MKLSTRGAYFFVLVPVRCVDVEFQASDARAVVTYWRALVPAVAQVVVRVRLRARRAVSQDETEWDKHIRGVVRAF